VEKDVIQSRLVDKTNEVDDDNDLVILNATAKWTDDQNNNTLEKINLTVKPGRLLAVIGSVGAGKVNILH